VIHRAWTAGSTTLIGPTTVTSLKTTTVTIRRHIASLSLAQTESRQQVKSGATYALVQAVVLGASR